ncbi:exo-alpha-sialidase [Chitinimonas lacunae]|uniref:Uncharacterized protein n=1 Tax=Chitinimonas lacunae TaxID=1963018 RepID=A0ABV8MR37_9NEIS
MFRLLRLFAFCLLTCYATAHAALSGIWRDANERYWLLAQPVGESTVYGLQLSTDLTSASIWLGSTTSNGLRLANLVEPGLTLEAVLSESQLSGTLAGAAFSGRQLFAQQGHIVDGLWQTTDGGYQLVMNLASGNGRIGLVLSLTPKDGRFEHDVFLGAETSERFDGLSLRDSRRSLQIQFAGRQATFNGNSGSRLRRLAVASDFTPPLGKVVIEGEGPWDKRLLSARSSDGGVSFVRDGVVLSDQANVPDLLLDDEGRLFAFYTGWTVGRLQNTNAVMVSDDWGRTWAFKYLKRIGAETVFNFVDPDVVKLAGGGYRMYYTGNLHGTTADARRIRIFYADSPDGIHWTQGGIAYEDSSRDIRDSTTALIGNTWHMYVLEGDHAVSSDGKTFTKQGMASVTADGKPYVLSNELTAGSQWRYYGFQLANRDIRSFLTSDGVSFTAESGTRLRWESSHSSEGSYIKDPALQRLPDGTVLMLYVSVIP